MANPSRRGRQKISTTIAPETLEYLEGLIANGEARTLAVAMDAAIGKLLVHENRERLAGDTAAYFANMTDEEAEEERRLEAAFTQSAGNDSER
jgi:hypothetical protein